MIIVCCETLSSRLRKRSAGADPRDPAIALDDVTLSAEKKSLLLVANQQQRFEMPQKLVGAPVLGKLERRTA
jgi:hypothetical protein